jgi:DNA modification methylase
MKVFHQSVFEKWPIEDKTIQAIITSPPYYSLRKYSIEEVIIGGDKDCKHEFELKDMELGRENRQGKGSKTINASAESHIGVHGKKVGKQGFCIHCSAWQGQHGLEPDYKLYLSHCKLWMQEAIRVLRDDGIIFVNLGDSFCSSGGESRHKGYSDPKYPNGRNGEFDEPTANPQGNVKPKSKLLIPERFVIMCVDELGLILRNHIVWFKPNGMPESCQDRFSKKWESIFMLTKNPKYYFDLDAVREPHKQVSIDRLKRAVSNNNKRVDGADGQSPMGLSQPRLNTNYKGGGQKSRDKNMSMAGSGYQNGDYLVANLNPNGKNPSDVWEIPTQSSSEAHYAMWPEALVKRMILCSTKAGDIVLDCFCGSGTTLRVADRLNRMGYGIDLGYQDIQSRRLTGIQKELLLNNP